MAYGIFNSAVTVLQALVIALGAGLGIWGRLTYLKDMVMIILAQTLMVNKEALHQTRQGQPAPLLFRTARATIKEIGAVTKNVIAPISYTVFVSVL